MRAWLVLVMALELGRVGHARAAIPWWTQMPARDAHRESPVLPSLAPLLEHASAAVVNISTNTPAEPGSSGVTGGDPRKRGSKPVQEKSDGSNVWDELWGPRQSEPPSRPSKGQGTGFIIHSTGYILTNAHVVEDSDAIEVRLLNDEMPRLARVVGVDADTDLALIKVDGTDLPVLPLGDSDALRVGDFVVAIGNPFGLGHSASFGMVSGKGRRDITPSGRTGLFDFIQTDAAINPGNSGGPLINLRGEVVGISSALNASGQGIGFAVPINMARQLIPQLAASGKVNRGWLGVQVKKITPELARSFGLDSVHGALVSRVMENGPAARAGVEPGDVITTFDGTPINHSAELMLLAASAEVGRVVDLSVHHEGQVRRLKVTLAAKPEDSTRRTSTSVGEDPTWGLNLQDLDERLRMALDLPESTTGVVVQDVSEGGLAALAGIKPNDLLVKINGRPVTGCSEMLTDLASMPHGEMVRLFIRRGTQGVFVSVPR